VAMEPKRPPRQCHIRRAGVTKPPATSVTLSAAKGLLAPPGEILRPATKKHAVTLRRSVAEPKSLAAVIREILPFDFAQGRLRKNRSSE